MGLFSKIFKKTPEQTFEDDTFGTLTFIEIKRKPENNYFEGSGLFTPSGNEIEYFITASIEGPTQEQKEFFETIQKDYSDISKKCAAAIENEFRNWKEDFKITDFDSEFTLVAITIPDLSNKPVDWNLAFETEHDENHQFTVYFKDFEIESVGVDG